MRAIIIPRIQAARYHQIKFEWWYGIDAIEKKDGDYFLTENLLSLIPKDFRITVNSQKLDLKTELLKLPVVDLKPDDFKEYELIDEKIIK